MSINKAKVEEEVARLRADPETYLKERKATVKWWLLPIIFAAGFILGGVFLG